MMIVDSCSQDGSADAVREQFPDITVIEMEQNQGYSAAVNRGMQECRQAWAFVCNADTEFRPDMLQTLAHAAKSKPGIAAAGAQQFYPDGSWQRSYGWFSGIKEALLYLCFAHKIHAFGEKRKFRDISRQPFKVEYLDGAGLLLCVDIFRELGGFDPAFVFYSEEQDYCYRARKAGYHSLFVPSARFMHIRGASSTRTINQEAIFSRKLMFGKALFTFKHKGRLHMLLGICIWLCFFCQLTLLNILLYPFFNKRNRKVSIHLQTIRQHWLFLIHSLKNSNPFL